jgi:hypothetical protein
VGLASTEHCRREGKVSQLEIFRGDLCRLDPPSGLYGHKWALAAPKHYPSGLRWHGELDSPESRFCIGKQRYGFPDGLIVLAGRNQYAHSDDEKLKHLLNRVGLRKVG